MTETGIKNPSADLSKLGINPSIANWNWSQAQLIEQALLLKMGVLADSGALAVNTGEFTGRAPKDKFIVRDTKTKDTVFFGDVNLPFEESKFQPLLDKMLKYLDSKEVYVKDAYACAHADYRLNIRLVTELPWSA